MPDRSNRYKSWMFDLDGTLLNSIDGIVQCFSLVLQEFVPDHGFTREEMILKIGEPVKKQMLDFSGGDTQRAPSMVARYREHMESLLPTFSLYDGAVELLVALKEHSFKTGLVTSKSRKAAAVSIESHQLAPLFDVIITADDTSIHKPQPEPLMKAAERVGVAAGEIVYVGDSVFDIRCAQAAGAASAAAYWGPFPKDLLDSLKPTFGFESLRTIQSFVETKT